jgi:hypothetical protein
MGTQGVCMFGKDRESDRSTSSWNKMK